MILCKKCGSIATYNSYFDAYICGSCHTKNYPSAERTNKKYEKKENTHMRMRELFNKMRYRLSR